VGCYLIGKLVIRYIDFIKYWRKIGVHLDRTSAIFIDIKEPTFAMLITRPMESNQVSTQIKKRPVREATEVLTGTVKRQNKTSVRKEVKIEVKAKKTSQ
jgi:hypothetical protein